MLSVGIVAANQYWCQNTKAISMLLYQMKFIWVTVRCRWKTCYECIKYFSFIHSYLPFSTHSKEKVLCAVTFLCPIDFLVLQKNGLIKKIRLNSKFMTSKPEKQTIAIYILPNVCFFFYQSFLSRSLTTHGTAGEGRGPSFIPL